MWHRHRHRPTTLTLRWASTIFWIFLLSLVRGRQDRALVIIETFRVRRVWLGLGLGFCLPFRCLSASRGARLRYSSSVPPPRAHAMFARVCAINYMPRGYCGNNTPADNPCFLCCFNPAVRDKNGDIMFCLDCPADRLERLAEAIVIL